MSTPQKFRKTALVEAVQWTGQNIEELIRFTKGAVCFDLPRDTAGTVRVETLEGELRCVRGDWILRGPAGECWPVREDIFAATYEPAEPNS